MSGWTPLATGDAVIGQFAAYGPLAAAFLVNLLATVGDKGQLVVVTLASRYDARTVFAGAMAAFGLWSALEVAFGQWLVAVLPGGVIALLTSGLFLVFGVLTLLSGLRDLGRLPAIPDGGADAGIGGRLLDVGRFDRLGPFGTSFGFVLLAEFGDKTQLLTINLAATFPDAPVAVFVGVVAALALRTGVDAAIGAEFERRLPTGRLELLAGAVFVAFGLHVGGLLPGGWLLAVVVGVAVTALAWLLPSVRPGG